VNEVPPPVLGEEDERLFALGLRQFDEGLFFECHDTLEEIWSGVRGPSRDFFQGLIQVAVGFYHLGNGNASGAKTLLRRALGRLEKYPVDYGGVDLGRLRPDVEAWLQRVEAGEVFPNSVSELPKLARPADR
jgi:predicted metal-dependent hydrolase